MKNLRITWKGIAPLIMHSCKCVNPLHPISKEIRKLNDKPRGQKLTEEEQEKLSDLEWEAGAYWQDGLGLYIPGENVEATIRNGAKANKKGKDIEKYVSVTDLYIPLDYGEKLTKEELIKRFEYRDTRPMVVSRARIIRTRPRFDQWRITFNLIYDESKIDLDTIVNAIKYAGSYVGLCDSRPKYGKFCAMIEELD
jgi:hypothetical protein